LHYLAKKIFVGVIALGWDLRVVGSNLTYKVEMGPDPTLPEHTFDPAVKKRLTWVLFDPSH